MMAATLLNTLLHDAFRGSGSGGGSTSWDVSGAAGPRVLDICCGVGHNSFQVADVCPEAELVACDCDFTNLYVARRFFIPGRICIGLDLEVPMPFPDGYFDAVLCSDAFVHMRSKYALVREVDRVLDERGLWLFSHFHNALVKNPNPGLPLSPSEYQRLFGFVEGRLVPETQMLRTFARERVLDFESEASAETLRTAHAYEWVAGRDPSRWCKRIENVTLPPSHLASLGINPVYQVQDHGDHVSGRMMKFSPDFEAECGVFRECVPPEFQIEKSFLSRLIDGSASPDDADRLQDLLRSFVLVQLPPNYGHIELSNDAGEGDPQRGGRASPMNGVVPIAAFLCLATQRGRAVAETEPGTILKQAEECERAARPIYDQVARMMPYEVLGGSGMELLTNSVNML